MDFLKKHARFLIVTVVLVVVLWIANSELAETRDELENRRNRAESMLNQNYRALFSDAAKFDGEPATIRARELQDEAQRISAIGDARLDRLRFETAPEFTPAALPEDAGADDIEAYYRDRLLTLQRELGYQRYFTSNAREEGALGFRESTGDGNEADKRERFARYLRFLDIVRTVAHSVERAGVERLNGLTFTSIDEQLAQRGVPTRPAATDEEPLMSGQGLVINVRAGEEALYNFLIELQKPVKDEMRNRYLAVESFTLSKPDVIEPRDALIDAEITVVAYRVNPGSSYPVDEESGQESSQRTGRAPRGYDYFR